MQKILCTVMYFIAFQHASTGFSETILVSSGGRAAFTAELEAKFDQIKKQYIPLCRTEAQLEKCRKFFNRYLRDNPTGQSLRAYEINPGSFFWKVILRPLYSSFFRYPVSMNSLAESLKGSGDGCSSEEVKIYSYFPKICQGRYGYFNTLLHQKSEETYLDTIFTTVNKSEDIARKFAEEMYFKKGLLTGESGELPVVTDQLLSDFVVQLSSKREDIQAALHHPVPFITWKFEETKNINTSVIPEGYPSGMGLKTLPYSAEKDIDRIEIFVHSTDKGYTKTFLATGGISELIQRRQLISDTIEREINYFGFERIKDNGTDIVYTALTTLSQKFLGTANKIASIDHALISGRLFSPPAIRITDPACLTYKKTSHWAEINVENKSLLRVKIVQNSEAVSSDPPVRFGFGFESVILFDINLKSGNISRQQLVLNRTSTDKMQKKPGN